MLDDTLSGLDGKTENQVVENLFGREGIMRQLGITAFLISNAGKWLVESLLCCFN